MKVLLKVEKLWCTLLATVLIAISLSVSVLAASSVDSGKLGSITINTCSTNSSKDTSFSGILFTIYKVAAISNSGTYRFTNDFAGSGVLLDQLSTAAAISTASKALANYAASMNISGSTCATEDSGIVKFNDLTLGYYLVVQTDNMSNSDFRIVCDPFLLEIPMKNGYGNGWVYNVVANPKIDVKHGAVILEKVNSSYQLLSEAVFRLEKKVYDTDWSSVPSGAQTYYDSLGYYYWKTIVSKLTTNHYGQIMVNCMVFGQYRFIEITAPPGYVLDLAPQMFSVSEAGSVTLVNGKYLRASGVVQTITVINTYRYEDHNSPTQPIPEDPMQSVVPTDAVLPTQSVVPTETEVPTGPAVPTENNSSPEEDEIVDEALPEVFDLPKTGGSISYAVCTYGGIVLMVCGVIVFLVSRIFSPVNNSGTT